jgi:integrase/recombinase XerD
VNPRRRRRRIGLTFTDWPPSDRSAWSKLFNYSSPLDPDVGLSHWSASSRNLAMAAYSQWLGFCSRRSKRLLKAQPEERVQPDIVETYLDRLQNRVSPVSMMMRIDKLYLVIRAMSPERDWEWLKNLGRRLRKRATPMRRKYTRLRHPVELLALGSRLMKEADASGMASLPNAVRFRNGLLIALLATRPVRLRSLTGMQLGRSLVRTGLQYRIALQPDDTKTRQVYDVPWPAVLHAPLERYLSVYRPLLLRGAVSDLLWIARSGKLLTQASLAHCIAQETKSAFGKPIYPHLFRDSVATAIADDDPEHVETIAALL